MTTAKRRELVYLGWLGHQNFGDDLLYETWRLALERPLDIVAPLHRKDYLRHPLRWLCERLRLAGRERLVLLGGGTTIGFDSWAYHVATAQRAYGARGALIPGAGAAESTDTHALNLQRVNWLRWASLSSVGLMGVRGPLTASECARHWRTTSVIGDPALLYPRLVEIARPDRIASIGVCVGSDPRSRFNAESVARGLEAAAAAKGLTSVTIFELSPPDRVAANELEPHLTLPVRRVVYTGDIAEVMREIAACAAFVSERLHGAVAAVSLGVPTVPMAYASKCDDFWLSVTGERSPITVGHSVEQLREAVLEAMTEEARAHTAVRTHALQDHLSEVAARVRGWLGGTTATTTLLRDRSTR